MASRRTSSLGGSKARTASGRERKKGRRNAVSFRIAAANQGSARMAMRDAGDGNARAQRDAEKKEGDLLRTPLPHHQSFGGRDEDDDEDKEEEDSGIRHLLANFAVQTIKIASVCVDSWVPILCLCCAAKERGFFNAKAAKPAKVRKDSEKRRAHPRLSLFGFLTAKRRQIRLTFSISLRIFAPFAGFALKRNRLFHKGADLVAA